MGELMGYFMCSLHYSLSLNRCLRLERSKPETDKSEVSMANKQLVKQLMIRSSLQMIFKYKRKLSRKQFLPSSDSQRN